MKEIIYNLKIFGKEDIGITFFSYNDLRAYMDKHSEFDKGRKVSMIRFINNQEVHTINIKLNN